MNTDQTTRHANSIDDHEEDLQLAQGLEIDSLMIRNENRTVYEVLRRIKQNQYIMNPDFQRDFVWNTNKQSRLIESIIMRIPLPVFYLAEDHAGKLIVVDGLQRLSTLRRFVNNELILRLSHQSELHGKRFRDLSAKLQNRIEDCNLILYIVDPNVEEQAKLEIFRRVNESTPLTSQQMRNCLYVGRATRFLKEQVETKEFLETTGSRLNAKSMQDREAVNRFCAFQILDISEYNGVIDDFLAKSLMRMNTYTEESLIELSSQLKTTLRNNYFLFGKHAFTKHAERDRGYPPSSEINVSLWDVMSTGLSRYDEVTVKSNAKEIRRAIYRLLDDDDFLRAITPRRAYTRTRRTANRVRQTVRRFAMFRTCLEDVLGAD